MSANFIANNGGAGIRVTGNAQGNKSFDNGFLSNGGLAIDLGGDGATANDAGDADAGPNGLQNYPALTSAVSTGSGVAIAYSLDSLAGGGPYHLEFFSGNCDASGRGQGFKFGAVDVPAGSGTAAIPVIQSPGTSVSATATDVNGNTSEFSPCIVVTAPAPPAAVITSVSPTTVAAGAGQMLTIHGTNLPGVNASDILFSQGGPEIGAELHVGREHVDGHRPAPRAQPGARPPCASRTARTRYRRPRSR